MLLLWVLRSDGGSAWGVDCSAGKKCINFSEERSRSLPPFAVVAALEETDQLPAVLYKLWTAELRACIAAC